MLQRGDIITSLVKTFPQNEQDILEPLGILSILVIPLRVGDEWYGLIGFDATVKPRLWSDEDIRLLQTAARMVEAYLERMQANEVLSQAKEAAEAANQAKSTFLSSLSHELRTPLNAIIGYSEMLEEDAVDSGYDDSVPDLKRINAAGRYLSELINNILDLSKIEAGKMELYLETFDIASVIDTVKSTIQPLVEKKHNTLSVHLAEGLGSMHTDDTKIRQVVVNLLSNAAKFTEKGQITLTAWHEMVDGVDWVNFRVADTGIGMSPEQMERIFQAFIQADSFIQRDYGGTGLGLTISLRLCRLMGGDVTVTSEKDKDRLLLFGCRLWFLVV